MTVKELIKRVRKENMIVKHKEDELYRLKTLCGVSGISYGGEKGSGSRNINKNEQSYLKYITFKDELNIYIGKAIENRRKLMALIDTLDNHIEIDVMYKYCIENYTIGMIADEMNYSRQAVHKTYIKAIEKMEKDYTEVDKS